jgi:hypothetical protein
MIIMTTRLAVNASGHPPHSGTVAPVTQWTVRAVSGRDAILTFGLQAPDHDRALLAALERLPWQPKSIQVDRVPLSPRHGGITFRDHQLKHQEPHDGCRFCR